MVQKIVRDVLFLGQTSVIAQPEDIKVGLDLQDTLRANSDRCVGMVKTHHMRRKKDACHWREFVKQLDIKT